MSRPLVRCRAALLFLCLALVVAFVSTTRSAQAEGKQGAAIAGVLAAESSPGAPIRARTAKAKPPAHASKSKAKAKAGQPGAKGKHGSHVKPAKAKPGKAGSKQGPARRGPKLRV